MTPRRHRRRCPPTQSTAPRCSTAGWSTAPRCPTAGWSTMKSATRRRHRSQAQRPRVPRQAPGPAPRRRAPFEPEPGRGRRWGPECGAERGDRGMALRRRSGQRSLEGVGEPARLVRIDLVETGGVGGHPLVKGCRRMIGGRERQHPRSEFEGHERKGVLIRGRRRGLPGDDLRSHVPGRSGADALRRHGGQVRPSGDAEIDEHGARRAEDDVARGEVTVDDACPVQRGEAITDRTDQLDDPARRDRPRLQQIDEGPVARPLGDDPAGRCRRVVVHDTDDRLVAHRSQRLHFPLDTAGVDPGGEDLDRDGSAVLPRFATVHRPGRPARDLRAELDAARGEASGQRRRRSSLAFTASSAGRGPAGPARTACAARTCDG